MNTKRTASSFAALLCFCFLLLLVFSQTSTAQNGSNDWLGPVGQGFVVQDKFGGEILGYDVDRNGTEGFLSEYAFMSDGKLLIATETFDQKTGKIVKVVAKKTETNDNYVSLGVMGSHIGIQQVEHVKGIYVDKRTYNTLNPLDGNTFTGKWNPPLNDKKELFEDVEGDQGTPDVAVMGSAYECCSRFVFGSDVGANTFGKRVKLTDPIFNGGVPPMLAWDSKLQRAVLAQAQGAPYTVPEIGLVDLTEGKITEFTGLGFGLVNGLAVDSATGIACTTTETDNSAEFYDLKNHTGIIVELPVIGKYSGATVASDPLHKLFLIAHPVPGTTGEIHVYDEQGNLKQSLANFVLGPGGAYMALNPSNRTGFVLTSGSNGNFSGLQSFKY